MANKQLKTLTIDDVPMEIFDCTVAGKVDSVTTTGSESAYTYGTEFTLEPNSFYLIQMSASFWTATTTGQTRHKAALFSGSTNASEMSLLSPSNTPDRFAWIVGWKTGTSSVNVRMGAASNRVLSCDLGITLYRLWGV